MDLIFNVILVIVVIVLGLRLLNYILNPSPQDTSVEDFDKFAKSIDTSSFSDNQKKSTEKFLSDIKKNIKDGQTDTKTSNEVEDTIKNEYYDNGRIKKETEKSTEEVEIMRLAKSIETSSSFVSLVELLPTNLSDYEGETFYDVTEEFRILLKNGSEVARGFVCISHNANYWDDDDEYHDDIQSHNEVMIVNGKQFTDYDDEKWGEQEVKGRELESLESKRIATFWDDGEAEEFFNSYIDKKCNKFK